MGRSVVSIIAVVVVTLFGLSSTEARPKRKTKRERVDVAGVVSTDDGQYVVILRTRGEHARYLPIWVGEIEALNIKLRMQRQHPPRPLTLNLLESVLDSGRIELTEIAIDDLKGGVFLGTIALKQGSRIWKIDARPSDAIGLAVGHGAPIWVAASVMEGAAVDPRELDLEDEPGDARPTAAPVMNYEETL